MSKTKSLRSGIVVIMLMLSMTLAPPLLMSQNAAATHDCEKKDRAVLLATFTYVNNDKCMENHVGHAVEDVRDAEANKTKSDIYQAAVSSDSQGETIKAIEKNYLNDTRPRVWMYVEKAVVNEYEEGGTLTNAKVRSRTQIEDYFTNRQKNIKSDWSKDMKQFEYLHKRAEQESNIDQYYVSADGAGSSLRGQKLNQTIQITYVNGSTETIDTFSVKGTTGGSTTYYKVGPHKGDVQVGAQTYHNVGVSPPNDNYDRYVFMNLSEYKQRWIAVENLNNQMQSESDAYVEAVWQELEAGRIDSNEVLSSITKMEEYGINASQDGGYHNTIGALAGMGIATPEMNETGVMTVEYKTNTYKGMVLADNPPNASWQTRQYNVSNISGLVMLATTDGETYEMHDGETFTIKEIEDKDGNTVDSVETKTYKYDTANASELDEISTSLLGLTQELEDRASSVDDNTGGGGGGSNVIIDFLQSKVFGVPIGALVAVLLVVLAFVQNKGRN